MTPFILALLAVAFAGLDSPAQIPEHWESRGPGGGGAYFAPSCSPHDRDGAYLASDMSQLLRTADGGLSWRVTDFRQVYAGTPSAVQFSADPDLLYCIDLSQDLRRVKKSSDGGASWSFLSADPTGGEVWSLWADPTTTSRLIVTGYFDLWISRDGGASFAHRYHDATGNGCYVAGVFWDGDEILIGTNAGLLRSLDGGLSLAPWPASGIPAGQGLMGFAGSRQGALRTVAGVVYDLGDIYPGVTGADYGGYRGVYTLDLAQATWTKRTTGLGSGSPFFLAATAANAQVLWLAGSVWNGLEQAPAAWRSGDGGLSWSQVLLSAGNGNVATGWMGSGGDRGWSYGEYALGLAASPLDAGVALVTDLGGVHGTADGGLSWAARYVHPASLNPAGSPTPKGRAYAANGNQNTSCWWLHWNSARALLACCSDVRAARSADGGRTWSFQYSGLLENSLYHVVQHSNGRLYGATSTAHDLYQSTYLQDSRIDPAGGKVLSSADGGATWTLLRDFGDPVVWLALDPNDPERLYASAVNYGQGSGGVWRTANLSAGAAASWTKLAAPPRTQGHPFNLHLLDDGTIVTTWSGRRDGAGAFTQSSGVFVSADGGASWQDRSHPNMLWWTKDLVVDPHDPGQNTWFAGVFSGWGGPPNGKGGLYRTADRGASWTRINSFDRVTSVGLDPRRPGTGFVTTEQEGLWYSEELLAAAPSFQPVLEFPFKQPERVFYDPHDPAEIWVSTFGNGLWVGRTEPDPHFFRQR